MWRSEDNSEQSNVYLSSGDGAQMIRHTASTGSPGPSHRASVLDTFFVGNWRFDFWGLNVVCWLGFDVCACLSVYECKYLCVHMYVCVHVEARGPPQKSFLRSTLVSEAGSLLD